MRTVEGRLLLAATDLSNFLACPHLTALDVRAAHGEQLPRQQTQLSQLLARLGEEHESSWVDAQEAHGRRVRRFAVDVTRDATTIAELQRAADETVAAMHEGWDIIYQPFFFDGIWQARPDFLVRVDRQSALGDHAYEAYDAKLARHVRAEALLQLCEYSLHVERVSGVAPERMHVVLGDGAIASHLTEDFASYHRRVREQLLAAVHGSASYPDKVPHCTVCEYAVLCDSRRRADSHLSLVARMRRDQVRKLNSAGVQRVEELAAMPRQGTVAGLAQPALDALREQARLQVLGADRTGPPLWELLPAREPGFGLEALPEPSPGDVFFDMEGDAFTHDEPLEYLFGAVEIVDGAPVYRHWMGHTPGEERRAFESFVDWLMQRLDADPAMHVYHYADYERSALQRLMGRHATREAEVDRLLRGGVLVDLYRVVRQSVRLSTEGYGLKQVERLYMPARTGDVADAESSLLVYARWERERDPALLDSIVRYNEEDCISTLRLRGWLEDRRRDAAITSGVILSRPALRDGAAPVPVVDHTGETAAVRTRLLGAVPDDPAARTPEQQAVWLLAQLLDYHRREQKVDWWRWFGHVEMTEDELNEDRDALGPLTFDRVVDQVKKSKVVRYTFEPQEHGLRTGATAFTPCVRDGVRDAVPVGRVWSLDNVRGSIDLLRGPQVSERGHPAYLIPAKPIPAPAQTAALLSAGRFVAEHGVDAGGGWRPARDLLLCRPPRRPSHANGPLRAPGESAEDAAVRIAAGLDGGCLAVQGPPGSGKTFTAARIALELVARGRRVAVTATAHKVIGRLLEEIADAAQAADRRVRIVQKCDADELCAAPGVRQASRNEDVLDALEMGDVDVAGGTAWLFADERVSGRFDTLMVDEAAQMSLADVIACSHCARNLVLVGDPRQLAQVVQGSHPPGVGVSALGHLLQDRPTVDAGAGIFLDRTWRMAPEVCAYVSDSFYQGQLAAVDTCSLQAIDPDSSAPLRGLHAVAVQHDGDRTYSEAEALRIREIVTGLLGRRWRHRDGSERVLGIGDILVVAPYNAQVACLSEWLPDAARVGTVDRFQGQEAAVSIFSMTTSSADNLPRNLEFLYSPQRLNVAVSRARCLSVLVYSPALLLTRCRTPEQMRLVNALCRYVDAASASTTQSAHTSDHARPEQLALMPAQ
jgi:uncharacterized protein